MPSTNCKWFLNKGNKPKITGTVSAFKTYWENKAVILNFKSENGLQKKTGCHTFKQFQKSYKCFSNVIPVNKFLISSHLLRVSPVILLILHKHIAES